MFEGGKAYLKDHPCLAYLGLSFLLAFLFVACFSTSTSFLYPATNYDGINIDSNFFLYEGVLLANGATPYRDFFDHKGLYHVVINAFAVLLGGRYALFAIEILFLWPTLYFLALSVRLLGLRPGASLFSLCLYGAFLAFMGGGNAEGEYLMPFIALSQYLYVRGISKNDRKSLFLGSFFLGFEMGLSLNSRPTDAMWGAAIAIYCIVYSIRGRKILDLVYNGLIAVGGLLCLLLAFWGWAIGGGFFELMMEDVFLASFAYLGSGGFSLEATLNRVGIAIFIVLLLCSYIALLKERRLPLYSFEFPFVALLVGALGYLLIARYTTYYWTSFTFLCQYASLLLFSRNFAREALLRRLAAFPFAFVVMWTSALLSLYYSVGVMGFSYQKSRLIEEAVLAIPEEAREEKGEVYALNCNATVYLVGGIETDFPYFANQSWWGTSNPGVISQTRAYLMGEERPTYLLAGKEEGTDKDFGDVIASCYLEVEGQVENPAFVLYVALS